MNGIFKPLVLGCVFAILIVAGWRVVVTGTLSSLVRLSSFTHPWSPSPTPKLYPLRKYAMDELVKRTPVGSDFSIQKLSDMAEFEAPSEQTFIERTFSFETDGRRVSGRLSAPSVSGTYPVIIMIRGYVDQESYETGIGTARTANYFAEQGYVTLAPDFLGYGASDESLGGLEDRFLTYTTVMDLISLMPNLNAVFEASDIAQTKVDPEQIGIWAHSNGGQIAMTVLATVGADYPTVLWAPVSKAFPYSVLYYSDEAPDEGKALRKLIADFELDYDINKYSFTQYLDRIKAPIRIHQGTADESIPVSWTNLITTKLQDANVDVETFYYDGEDHNFNQGSWERAAGASEEFYRTKLRMDN